MSGSGKSEFEKDFPILFGSQWQARCLDQAITAIDPDALYAEYQMLREQAPRRSARGKRYFVGHSGVASAKGRSNRVEEHCAIALVNLRKSWPHPGHEWFRLLDYQVPLKARQSDGGIGKIDLIGVTNEGRLMIIELKVIPQSGGRSDAPAAALMEGLRYAAIVEANLEVIASEAESLFGARIARVPPIVQLLAPKAWWREWLELSPAGAWPQALHNLVSGFEAQSGVMVEWMAFDDVETTPGLDGQSPRLDREPALYPVHLAHDPPLSGLLSAPSSNGKAMADYMGALRRSAWAWADRHHKGQLDGGSRRNRPPVLKPEFAAMNVLVPPDGSRANEIRNLIKPEQRHTHFASLRSSQALTQSVFGAISAADRLDILEAVTAECGRPAFFSDSHGWTLSLEHEVKTLGEPRPTSIDVLLKGPGRRVAVECKFTEKEFGTCSRPDLQPKHTSYAAQRCDGNYRAQAGRPSRCALTAIGVRYWEHLPFLFAWDADRDHEPCPFRAVYQLARNALAAAMTFEGNVDPSQGHALVLYDARNPAFQFGGKADRQWEAAIAACLVPGLMRRLSWQRLLTFIAREPNLAWLVEALRDKYALVPDYTGDAGERTGSSS